VLAVPSEPVFAVPSGPVSAVPSEPVSPAPDVAVPESAQEVPAEPVLAGPDASAGERVATPVVEAAADIEGWAPITGAAPSPAPVVLSTTADPMWGTPSCSATLWGGSAPAVAAPATTADTPIRGEVMTKEPTSAPLVPAATITENPVVDAPVVEAPVVVDAVAEEPVVEVVEDAGIAEVAPLLARTASDPAPLMSLDATTVMPPLSLLPPLPSSRGRGRPPVPPVAPRHTSSSAGRSSAAGPSAEATVAGADEDRAPAPAATPSLSADAAGPAVDAPAPAAPAPTTGSLATVTRLPVAPPMSGQDIPELSEHVDEHDAEDVVTSATPAPTAPPAPRAVGDGDLAAELERLGLPPELLGDTFADDVAARGAYAALTRSLALRLPTAPEVPSGAGEAVFVVGPGVDALRAARTLAASLRLDPDRVQWATRGDLAGLVPTAGRVTNVDAAIESHRESLTAGTVTIVAVDAPLRTDTYWMARMMSIWTPVAVWAVVEATRKPEDLGPWIDGLPRVDALIVQDTDLSADPAAVLRRVNAPVALLDGVRATPHRWASLLCERLESTTA
jgi:hypothetical protein